MISVELHIIIWNISCRKWSCPISSSVESDQEASDDDGVDGRDEEAIPHLELEQGLLKNKQLVL